MSLEQEMKDKAGELGFDAVGITDVSRIGSEHVEHLEAWLHSGFAGRMEYMHRNVEKRIEPSRLRKGAQSVIVVALNYKPREASGESGRPATVPSAVDSRGRVAIYAQYEDYHLFIGDRLRELAGFICARTGRQDRFKVCVDAAPVAEKALAVRAGLGFIGKNHLLIHPRLGPQILLGELFTSVPLEPDEPARGTCGDCDRCIRACPTGALRPDGLLDATRCISYLTQYESADRPIGSTGDWLFGCDECLLACPFYRNAPQCTNRHFRRHPERARLSLRGVLELTPETFERQFRDSPLKRTGLEMLQRNAQTCLAAR